MRPKLAVVLTASVAAALAAVGITAPLGADVTEVGQGAATVLINVDVENVGPIETVVTPVNLPATGGGPFTDSAPSFSEPDVFVQTGALEASTEGGNLGTHQGFATSSASIAELQFDEILGAQRVESECRADGDGTTGSTTFTTGVVNDGGSIVPIPANPAPNTLIEVIEGVTVTLNEQTVTHVPGSQAEIVVNAVHVELAEGNSTGIVGDIWFAQSICRASGPDVLRGPDESVEQAPPRPVAVTPRLTG